MKNLMYILIKQINKFKQTSMNTKLKPSTRPVTKYEVDQKEIAYLD